MTPLTGATDLGVRSRRGRRMARATVVVLAWLAVASVTAAAEAPRLGLTPVGQSGAWFDLTLAPGERRQLAVEAANFGEEPILARTYPSDVYSIVNGGFGADLYGDEPTGVTTWVDYGVRQIVLGPGEALSVDFAVTVPPGTPPGQYLAALVIENAEPIPGSGPVALDQVNRSAIAVAIDVPGPRRPALTIGEAGPAIVAGHSILTFEVANPGNVHLRPAGSLRLMAVDGVELASTEVHMDQVYAGSTTRLEVPMGLDLRAAAYCVELSLTDAATGAHDAIDCVPVTTVPAAPDPRHPPGPGALPGTSTFPEVIRSPLSLVLGSVLVALALLVATRRRLARGMAR